MLTVAVACLGDIKSDPRPRRMAKWLGKTYQVEIISPYNNDMSFPWRPLEKKRLAFVQRFVFLFLIMIAKEDIAYSRKWKKRDTQNESNLNLIICHDLDLLPYLFKNYSNTRIILDAREYYPEQYNDRILWRILLQPGVRRICKKYLPLIQALITVSNPIAERYTCEFQTNSIVVDSSAEYEPRKKLESNPSQIRFVTHGLASKTRHIEVMIEAFGYLPNSFTLDLVLVPGNSRYFRRLERLVRRTPNTRILSPVVFSEIPKLLCKYDAGVIFFPPTNFNIASTLPNKFFECIQARLPLVIGPTPPMVEVIEKYKIGFVTADFSPASLAFTISKITRKSLGLLVQNLDICALEKNAQSNGALVRSVISDAAKL